MTLDEVTKMQQRCIRALDEFDAPPDVRKFCLEVVEYEEETAAATLRWDDKLRSIDTCFLANLEPLRRLIQSMTKDFKSWNRTVDSLVLSGSSLPPLEAKQLQGHEIQAPSSIHTKQFEVSEGDQLTVTDTSQPNVIKVRTRDGKEDLIPILTWILPNSDKTVSSLLQRLVVQLLSSWTECVGQSGKLLLQLTKNSFQTLKVTEVELVEANGENGSRLLSKLKKVQEIVRGLEGQQTAQATGAKEVKERKEIISDLSKTFNAYQLFYEHWNNFRLLLKGRKSRPICVFENLDDFKHHVTNKNKQVRSYTTTFTVESTEIREETVHIPISDMDDDTSSYGGGGSWRQEVEAEQLTSESQEEKKRYIIRSVKDPRTGESISLQDATQLGIVDMANGLYVNPDTKESHPIAAALTDGHIKVEYMSKSRSTPKTDAIGLVTIKDRIHARNYSIVGVIDARTAERVDLTEAKKRGLVNKEGTHFVIITCGEKITMEDAVDSGWVVVEYDREPEEHEVKMRTYAIRGAVDQRLRRKVPFKDAVQRRLIDRETGNYVNNVTGETIYVLEAIRKGFLKAKLIEDPTTLDIDPNSKMVMQGIHRMKSLVTGLTALTAMRESARSSTSSE